jgi:sec-independent protein translocase protein TatC
MAEDKEMTIFEHLDELRSRLIKAAIGLVFTAAVSLAYTTNLLKWLIVPAGNVRPVFLRPQEGLVTYLRVALLSGVILAMPVIVYELVQFILPALQPSEKRYLFLIVPGASVSFAAGAAFAYFVMLPVSLRYLLSFGSEIAEATWAIGEYISFVTGLMFWMGVVFQMPLAVFILSRLRIVNSRMLSQNRKYAVLVIAVVAAIITPTTDPLNMVLVMAPLMVLFEISVIVSRFA